VIFDDAIFCGSEVTFGEAKFVVKSVCDRNRGR
jgi:hypothetical protein